jgi:hypothetical protein
MLSTRVSVPFWAAALPVAVVLSCLLSLSYDASRAEAAYPCSGKHVYPSQNLVAVANDSRAGTTFCIHDGTYNVSKEVRVQDGDSFVGLYDDATRPSITTTQALNVFNANGSSGVLIKGLKVSGAVGGNYCEPNCGRGIYGGNRLTVDDVWLTGNKNQGIGGAGPVVVVKGSLIERNGSHSFGRDGGPITTAGIKSSKDSLTILSSTIRDNYWNGVWCDNDCEALTVQNSTITGNGKAGIHAEVSRGPTIVSGNAIKGNGTRDNADHRVGLLVVSSADVDAFNNTFGSNVEHGVEIEDDGRNPGIGAVKIHDNTMNGDSIKGCKMRGVSCYGN